MSILDEAVTVDIDKLEALAKAATQYEWRVHPNKRYWIAFYEDAEDCNGNGTDAGLIAENRDNDAAFVAAANPAVVLELIRELRELRELACDGGGHGPLDEQGRCVDCRRVPSR